MKQTLLKSVMTGALVAVTAFGAAAQQKAIKQGGQRNALPTVAQRAAKGVADSLQRLTMAEKEVMAQGQQAPQLPPAGVKENAAIPRRADSPETRIYFAVNPQDKDLHPAGAYWVDVNDPNFTYHRIGDQQPNATKGGVAVDDIYYATQVYSSPLKDWTVKWNLADSLSFTGTVFDGVYQLFANDAAYDPWTDRVVGIVMSNYAKSIYSLGVIDYEKHSKQLFGPEYAYGKQLMSFAAGPECYWGIDYNNNFYRIDKFTGEPTLIGQTGVNANIIQGSSMIYEPKTKKLYYSPCDNNRNYLSSMFTIDPTTGKATVLWEDSIRERRCGLWVDEPTTSACPGLSTDLSASFGVGALKGTLTFTSPTKTHGGADASGALTYTILANGRQVATGNTSYGATQTVDITIPGPGSYKFSVKTENAAGPSRWARLEAALGFEKPGKPVPVAEYNDGTFKVNWKPVALSATGAPMDTTYITYKVIRYPDSVMVADAVRDTVITDTYTPGEALATYYYGVQAVYGGVAESDPGLSNSLTFGHIIAPWTEDFKNHKHLDAFTILNVNNDQYTWGYDSIYGREWLHIMGYNDNGMNDWLITPKVKMEPGYLYRINYRASNLLDPYNAPEQVRVLFGTAPTVEGLNTLVLDTLKISSRDWVRFGDYVQVNTAGDYYFGLQAVNNKGSHILNLFDASISAPVSLQAPDYAKDARIHSSYDDPSNVDITFTTPTTRCDGTPLQSISRIEVMRGDTLVVTYANPRPGTPIHCTDMVGQRGRTYAYSIVAYNEAGAGKELIVEDFIGIRKPTAPQKVFGWEKNGKVTLTWEAPATDEEGNALNPENVKYNVSYRVNQYTVVEVAKDTSANSVTFDYAVANPQAPEFLVVSVTAVTEGGEGGVGNSYPIACGPEHSVPFIESFAGGTAVHPIGGMALSGDAKWHLYSDNNFSDLDSYDKDGGFVGMEAKQQGAQGVLSFAKIDMSKMKKPVLNFYLYNIIGNTPDDNEFEVIANDGNGFVSLYSGKFSDFAAQGWNKVSVPMTAMKGKTIQLGLKATTRSYVYSLFDNFRLVEQLSDNLAVGDFNVPAMAAANQEVAFTVKVENNGENAAKNYRIDIYRDSKVFMQKTVTESLASGASAIFTMPATFTTVDPDEASFVAEISYDADLDLADNISGDKTVKVIKSSYPVPAWFQASADADGKTAQLSWGAPNYDNAEFDAVTEGFETAAPWNSSKAAEWTLINRDGKIIGGANGISFPNGIQGSDAGFFTFQYGSDSQFNQSWQPYAGNMMLISVFAKDGSKSDDWAISPELSGKAQTVSLRARSYDVQYPESFRILYSKTDANPASFTEAKAFNNISADWTLYSADLPAGAKYMAINGVSQDKFMLFIDEVSYVPGGKLELKGYNVYRDGKRVTEQPVSTTSYKETLQEAGDFGYQVTAMYDRGESRPTELKTVHLNSVSEIAEGVEIGTEPGAIIINGAADMPVKVVDAAGRVIFSGNGNDNMRIAVATGLYMVSVKDATVKILVK